MMTGCVPVPVLVEEAATAFFIAPVVGRNTWVVTVGRLMMFSPMNRFGKS